MTFKGPVDTVLSIGGRNLTGMGMLMNIQEQPFSHKTEEVDLIGAPYIFSAKTGKKGWRFSVGGYVRDDAGSVLRLSNADTTAREPHSAIYARFGDLPGAHADIIPAVIASGGDFDLPKDGLIKVNNLQYQLASQDVHLDSTLIANRADVSASASPYSNLRHDFGLAFADPWTMAIHAGNIVWDGATVLEVRIYTSSVANGNSGWSRVGANLAHSYRPASGNWQDSVETSNTNLGRWVGLGLTWTGGGGDRAADIIAAIRRA